MPKSLKKNAVYSAIKSLMNIAFPLVSFPYASRILLPEGIGRVNFANSIVDYFLLIAGLGINAYGSREAAIFRGNKHQLNKFTREMLFINFCSMLIAYILFFIAIFCIPQLNSNRILLCVIATKILFQSIGMEWLYNSQEEYQYITIRAIFFQIAGLVFLFIFVKNSDDYIKYALIGVISSVGANICNLFCSRKFINIFERHIVEIRKHLKSIFTFLGLNIASRLYELIDTTMLGFLINDVAVGFYVAANKMISMVISLMTAVLNTFLPRSSFYYKNNMKSEYTNLVENSFSLALFFSIPATVGMFLLSKSIIMVFSGSEYLPALFPMRILCPEIIFCTLCAVTNNIILNPQKKEKIVLYAQIIACVLNILLNNTLIRRYNVKGAAIATFISNFAVFIFVFIFSRKYLLKKQIFIDLLQICLSSIVMGSTVYTIIKYIQIPLLQILCGVAFGSIVYTVIMCIMKNRLAVIILKMIKIKI